MRVISVCCLLVLVASGARGQDERTHWAQLSDQNQLGLLAYCANQGHSVGQRPAEVGRQGEPGSVAPDVAAASVAGRAGVIQYTTPQATLAEDAAASGTTVAYRCEMMGLQRR